MSLYIDKRRVSARLQSRTDKSVAMATGTSKPALRPIHKGAQKNNKNNKNKEKTVTKKEKEELLAGCDPIKAGGSSILKIRDDLVEHGSNGGSNTPLRHTKIKFTDELSPVHEELKKPLSHVSLMSNAYHCILLWNRCR